jgi:hypothetical protein
MVPPALSHLHDAGHAYIFGYLLPVKSLHQRTATLLADLRAGKVKHGFPLPDRPDIEEAFVDLLKITAIHRSFLQEDQIERQLVTRLSAYGTMVQQNHLSMYFGTQFGLDQNDQYVKLGAAARFGDPAAVFATWGSRGFSEMR